MTYPTHLLPTTVVGSYPQPDWLVDRAVLSKSVPRTRMHAMWRLPAEHLEEAQDDATIVAIRDMERAGIDIVTDGEIRRESYSNRFALALDGIDAETPGEVVAQFSRATAVPRVALRFGTPEQRWLDTITVDEAREYLQAGEFGEGSMAPKVAAVADFVASTPSAVGIIGAAEEMRATSSPVLGSCGRKVIRVAGRTGSARSSSTSSADFAAGRSGRYCPLPRVGGSRCCSSTDAARQT